MAQVMGKMHGGGVEAVVMNYYRHIDRDRVQFDFLVDSDSTCVPKAEVEGLGGRVFFIPPYQHILAYQNALRKLYQEHGWRIVHSHENALSVFPLRVAKQVGVPVRIAHSHTTSSPEERAKYVAKNILRMQANRYPTVKFACGQAAGEWLFGKNSGFRIVTNAIDIARFSYSSEKRMSARKRLSIDGDAFVILHIGRFVKVKNHAFLIDVFEALLQRRPDAILLLAGDGYLRPKIERKVAISGVSERVVFLGQRSDSDALYSAADCFCLPSLYEGLPVVSVEAQASGIPVLMSSDVSAEAIITSRTRALSRSAGPEEWADALASIDQRLRLAPLTADDREAMMRYDINVQNNWLTEAYLELAEGKPA